MKTTLFSTVSAAVTGILLTAVSCNTSTVTPTTGTTGELRLSAPFTAQTTQFAFDLAKQVNAQDGPAKNVFISPLSLHMALGMIMNGANGQTAQEIQKTLKLDAQTLADANATYQNLMANLPGVDPKVTLRLANSVWYRNTFTVETAFQDLLKQTFSAEISAQDFNNPATVGTINSWASQKTNGKIPKVIDQIQPDNVLFLMNALYFKGDWTTRFDAAKTTDWPFTLVSDAQTTVRMMRLNTQLNHASRPGYTAFELPYGAGNYVMTVLLPTGNSTADVLINNLNSDEWALLQKNMTKSLFDIGLPKFTVNYEAKLNNVLSTLGMPTAFTDRADFTKINAQGGLLLSFVKQNTFVAVDEAGTEAAAVTTGGISTTSVQMPTLCDRPFVFVIHEKTSGAVLFVGKIADPTKTNT
ncbi:serpin family protein [Spirosoma sp.]|uniref:serpin family protein n=1 Tax=Spirosoma sp. TaxID=1899569 RepID=UPI002604255C|nr:serpin family protein [Spirosoma sp.]MCX6213189.1 serpin family protein [Spirosoma sp.]